MLSGVYVPFRAPIVTKLYSFDRFLLLRGWVPAINLILITFIPGLLVPMVHPFLNDFVLGNTGIPVPFFVGTALGYIVSLFFARLFFLKEKTLRLVIIGLGLEIVAMSLLNTDISIGISSVLLGLGLGFIHAGIPDDVCEAIPPLPTRNSQHHPFVGKRSWYFPGYRYCVLHGIGYRQDAPYRTDGSFYRFAVLRIGHLSLLYKEEGKIK